MAVIRKKQIEDVFNAIVAAVAEGLKGQPADSLDSQKIASDVQAEMGVVLSEKQVQEAINRGVALANVPHANDR